MPFTVKSKFLSQKLAALRAASSFNDFKICLKVPDDLFWWVYLEYGTGIHGSGHGEYKIEPIPANHSSAHPTLAYFNVKEGEWQHPQVIYSPGIPAFHMISTIWDEVLLEYKTFVAKALKENNYNAETVKELIYTECMPKIKGMIIESFRNNLPDHHRSVADSGRLDMSPADAFEEGLEIV